MAAACPISGQCSAQTSASRRSICPSLTSLNAIICSFNCKKAPQWVMWPCAYGAEIGSAGRACCAWREPGGSGRSGLALAGPCTPCAALMDLGDNEVRAKCVGGRTRPLRAGQRRQPLRAAIDQDKAGSLNLNGHNNAARRAAIAGRRIDRHNDLIEGRRGAAAGARKTSAARHSAALLPSKSTPSLSLAARREQPTSACRLSRNAGASFCALAAVPAWVTTQLSLQRTMHKAVIGGLGAW